MLYKVFGQSLEESERNSIHTWIMNVPFRVDPIMTSEVDWEDAQSDEEGEYVGDSTRCTILQLLFVLFHNVCLWAWVTGGIDGATCICKTKATKGAEQKRSHGHCGWGGRLPLYQPKVCGGFLYRGWLVLFSHPKKDKSLRRPW